MSILKSLQNYLKTYAGMEIKPLSEILTDQVSEYASSYAIAPSGNSKIEADILGNKRYENNYIFFAKEAAQNEIDRQENYGFLEAFSEWIEEQNDAGNFPVLPEKYEAESISVSNAMLVGVEEDGTGLYQVQIKLIFVRRG